MTKNTFASFPDDTLDDTIQRFRRDHVSMASVSRYGTQLTVPNAGSNSNSERFNSCLVYPKAGYPHTIIRSSTAHKYQNSLLPATSKKPAKCKLQRSSGSSRASHVT